MIKRRRRFKHTHSLQQRLADQAEQLREEAEKLPAGSKRDRLLLKLQQSETALYWTKWLASPGLKPPT